MIPRRQGGSDAGVHLTYSEELTTRSTKGALECEVELSAIPDNALNYSLHVFILLFHAFKQFELRSSAQQILLRIMDPEVIVAIDIICKKSEPNNEGHEP